jgi:hypothetical protein
VPGLINTRHRSGITAVEFGQLAAADAERPAGADQISAPGQARVNAQAMDGADDFGEISRAQATHHRHPFAGTPRRRTDNVAYVGASRPQDMRPPDAVAAVI